MLPKYCEIFRQTRQISRKLIGFRKRETTLVLKNDDSLSMSHSHFPRKKVKALF